MRKYFNTWKKIILIFPNNILINHALSAINDWTRISRPVVEVVAVDSSKSAPTTRHLDAKWDEKNRQGDLF